jgi:replication factor C subunit 1
MLYHRFNITMNVGKIPIKLKTNKAPNPDPVPNLFKKAQSMADEKCRQKLGGNLNGTLTNEPVVDDPHKIVPHNAPVVLKQKIQLKMKSVKIAKNNCTLWTEKYRPTQLDEFVGNADAIDKMCDWFKKYKAKDTSIKRALLLSGCPGTCKTSIAHVMLRKYGYDVKEYNASDIRSKKLVEENLKKLITMTKVNMLDKKTHQNPYGIVMDEVDGMSTGDKGGIGQLISIINPIRSKTPIKKDKHSSNKWIPPIICICNNNYDKKISELKKDCMEIKFEKPTIFELCKVIDRITILEGINMTDSAKKFVAELSQGDFRRLVFLLQNFSNIKKQIIDINDIYEYYDVISKKTIELNSYEITNKIFSKALPLIDIVRLYDSDKSLLPMMIHENYVKVIDSQNVKTDLKLQNCADAIDAIICGDLIEKVMYNTQNWHLQNVHGLTSCYLPSYYSNLSPKLGHNGIKWASALEKFSAYRQNMKTMHSIRDIISNGNVYNADDLHLLSKLILHNLLDQNGNQSRAVSFMKKYNFISKDIEKMIKIDKLNDKYRDLYKPRTKTQIQKICIDLTQRSISKISYDTCTTNTNITQLKTENNKNDNDAENGNDNDAENDNDNETATETATFND